ncbi:MAG: hypothetical protein JG718_10945 [Candidatus Thiothrix moscowensis]|nr:hypothetical protein [Candidatus Thiothrix moscowensis]
MTEEESLAMGSVLGVIGGAAIVDSTGDYNAAADFATNTINLSAGLEPTQDPANILNNQLGIAGTAPKTGNTALRLTTEELLSGSTIKNNSGISKNSGGNIKTSGNCQTTMRYISSQFPRFTDPTISNVQTAMMAGNVIDDMAAAKAEGLVPQSAIQSLLAQAEEYDRVAREALHTASEVDAFGSSASDFMKSIKSGKYNNISCEGIRNSSICAAIINKMSAIYTREEAKQFKCHTGGGNSW